MLKDEKNIGVRFFKAQDESKGALDVELCTGEYRAYIGGNPPMDIEGHNQFGKMFYLGFPDLKHSIDDVISEGEKVAVRFTMSGTHTGNFIGIFPTNKSINISAMAVLHLKANKVNKIYGEFNQMNLMKQLGVVPETINN
jgi:predicted ester cyclase